MKKVIFVIDVLCASVILTQTCYAYIDPATTSYIIQIAAGIVIALGTVIGICWNKFKRLFKKKNDPEQNTPEIKKDHADEKDTITADDLMNDE